MPHLAGSVANSKSGHPGTQHREAAGPFARGRSRAVAASSLLPPQLLDRGNLCRLRREFTLGGREVDIALGVLHRFFGELLGFDRLGFVEVVAADRSASIRRVLSDVASLGRPLDRGANGKCPQSPPEPLAR